jgi:hypothetical protein
VTDSAAIGEHAGEVETRYAASSLDGARPLSQQAQRRQERETQAKPGLLSLSRSLSASVSAIPFLLPSSLRTLFFNPRVCCRFQAIRLLASPAESSLRGALILIFISLDSRFFWLSESSPPSTVRFPPNTTVSLSGPNPSEEQTSSGSIIAHAALQFPPLSKAKSSRVIVADEQERFRSFFPQQTPCQLLHLPLVRATLV